MAQWLVLPPHSLKVVGSIPRAFVCGVCLFSQCLLAALQVLRLPATLQRHASEASWNLEIGIPKAALGLAAKI